MDQISRFTLLGFQSARIIFRTEGWCDFSVFHLSSLPLSASIGVNLLSSTTSCASGAMVDGFGKTITFLAHYCDELVQLQKPTLEALLKSSRAKQVKEWNTAKNLWYRKVPTLAQRQKIIWWIGSLFSVTCRDWMRWFFCPARNADRMRSFLAQHVDTIKRLGANKGVCFF